MGDIKNNVYIISLKYEFKDSWIDPGGNHLLCGVSNKDDNDKVTRKGMILSLRFFNLGYSHLSIRKSGFPQVKLNYN